MSSENATSPSAAVASLSLFIGPRLAVQGSLADLAAALVNLPEHHPPILAFDDATGAPIDAPYPHDPATPYRLKMAAVHAGPAVSPRLPDPPAPTRQAPAPAGRPRLGVVAREVTLLPRHWEWLGQQPGGASAALRRLVDAARSERAGEDASRQARERTYRVMSPLAGHLPGFEDATRALFDKSPAAADAFAARIADWPKDIREYLARMTRGAFGSPA